MGFKPVDFSHPDRTVLEPHSGNAFKLPPGPSAIQLVQHRGDPYRLACRDDLGICNFSKDFKMRCFGVSHDTTFPRNLRDPLVVACCLTPSSLATLARGQDAMGATPEV